MTGLPTPNARLGTRLLAAVKAMFKSSTNATTRAGLFNARSTAPNRILKWAERVPSRLDGNGKELKREASTWPNAS
jgi:hypothetical protein